MLTTNDVFNFEKTDYQVTSLFLGQAPGLFDTVNKQYPNIWTLYKTMKSLDWDEIEYDYSSCNTEFKTLPRTKTQKMIKSLAWQWEADSIASRSISHIVSLFNPCSELWAAWQQISTNEVVHAATYSEITRSSFDNPREVLAEILAVTEAKSRLEVVGRELSAIRRRGLEFSLGLVDNDQETYNAIFMFTFIMFVLERLQFMASFAVTFALGHENLFQPICKAVQKIAQDEYEVHVELDVAVLRHELTTDRGRIAYEQLRPRMNAILNEVTNNELDWNVFVFTDDETGEIVEDLDFLTLDGLNKWVLFSATNVARTLELDLDHPQIEHQPLHYMKTWMNIGDTQPSPQSEANGQYKVGIMRRDDDEVEFVVDF